MQLQAKEHQRLDCQCPTQTRRKQGRSIHSEEAWICCHFISNFWPSTLWEDKFMLFSTIQFVEICYSSSRKLILWLNHLLAIDQFKFSILGVISFNRLQLSRICIFHPSHLICWHTIFHGVCLHFFLFL